VALERRIQRNDQARCTADAVRGDLTASLGPPGLVLGQRGSGAESYHALARSAAGVDIEYRTSSTLARAVATASTTVCRLRLATIG